MTNLILDMAELEYHAHPALSSTGARELLKAPAKFYHAQWTPRVHRTSFDTGTAAHAKVLGVGWPIVTIPEELLSDDGGIRSAAAKAWVAEARENNQIPIKASVAAEVNAMAESVLAHPKARMVLEQEGAPEVSVFGTDPDTGVDTRCRVDFLGMGEGRRVAVDLKTSAGEASAAEFARTVAKYGYHIQDGHYTDTLLFAEHPVDAFVFIVVEKEPPYLTAVHVLEDDYRVIGQERAAHARRLFAHGIQSGEWPGYPDDIQIVRTPTHVIYDHIDRESNAA